MRIFGLQTIKEKESDVLVLHLWVGNNPDDQNGKPVYVVGEIISGGNIIGNFQTFETKEAAEADFDALVELYAEDEENEDSDDEVV